MTLDEAIKILTENLSLLDYPGFLMEEKAKGMYFSDRCNFCYEFGEKVESFLCEQCRDKIFEWLNSKGWSILQKE